MRTAARIFWRDLKRIAANPVALVVAVGVCVIPSVYAWLNILANWDPYENTSTVPVDVVVLDEGAEVPDLGHVNAGEMVRERLAENTQLGWTFVDGRDQALDDVRAGRAYAALVIPEDFTASLADVMDGDARPARVGYYVNEKANAVAPKVTDTGATTLENQIAQQFVDVAATTVTERLQGAVGTAADGIDGARTDAAGSLSEVEVLLGGLADDLNGTRGTLGSARGAVASAREAVGTVADAAGTLSSDLDGALDGLSGTRGRARELARSLSDALGTGARTVSGLSSRASHDIGAVAGDVGWAQGKLDAAISQIEAANGTVQTLRLSLEGARKTIVSVTPSEGEAATAQTELTASLDQEIDLLVQLSDAQLSKLEELRALSREVADGADAVRGLADGVNDAVQTGTGTLADLRADLAQGAAPELSSALDTIADAGGRLAGGASALPSLLKQADATLAQMDALLRQGADTLAGAASSVRDAAGHAGALADDLSALEGAREAAGVSDLLALDPGETGAAVADPIEMVSEPLFPVATYGSGVAPFYTNLALWVGGFVLVAIYKLEVDREGLGDAEVSPTQAFFGRWMLLALLGQVQAVICCAGDVALGVQCVSPAAFVLAGMVASFVYVFVVYALAVAFKHVGKALGVLLVVLQIPGASGLYPIQMQPEFFRALNPWLPFTYGIDAMREAVAGFYDGAFVRNLLALLLFLVPALLIGVVARRHLLGVNALFDRKMAQTDLLISEHVGEKDAGRLGTILDALAASPAHREALLARAERFERAYPQLVRRGLVALLVVPLCLLALLFVLPAKFALLVCWIVSLVATCGYLIGLEYVRERLGERRELARKDGDELLALAREEKGGDGR